MGLRLLCAVALLGFGLGTTGSPQSSNAAPPVEGPPATAALRVEDPPAAAPRVALTFYDLPATAVRYDLAIQEEMTDALMATLARWDAPTIGFVNESKLYEGDRLIPGRVGLLETWLEAGHPLGNHTFSHPNLHATPVEEYLVDIERGEQVIRPLANDRGIEVRYFRHPQLRTGRDMDTKARVNAKLEGLGYTIAPVTMDNADWIFARAFDRALDDGDSSLAQRVADAYVPYMDSIFGYYEKQSEAILGYRLPQILLLHANRLNARTLDDLLRALDERGYEWITLDEALEDPAYRRVDDYLGPAGITWLHRWALSDGKRGQFFAGEPTVPDFVTVASGL